MDAYYVSIEVRDNPDLADKAVAVGGRSERRGVLATCNYIARSYGIHSAMPTVIARQKCPNLIVLPGRMDVYQAISQQIRAICGNYCDKIEPLSLDEMYLDLSLSNHHLGSATLTAKEIRQRIFAETGLTASAGIAPLKFLAKIASDYHKPNNQFTIAPAQVQPFIETLELKKISGVGKVTQAKLANLGLFTGGDVINYDKTLLIQQLGKFGQILWQRCNGIDNRVVETTHIRKSVGVERTFQQDISELARLHEILGDRLFAELRARAEKYLKTRRVSKLGVKLKFADFQQTTKETVCGRLELGMFRSLLDTAFDRAGGRAVRLMGIHLGLADDLSAGIQLELDV